MLHSQRAEAYQRLKEVRLTLETIKSLESTDVLVPDPSNVTVLRGLYYVHLYAALEFTVNSATQAVLQQIAALNVRYSDFVPSLYSIALDGAFKSVRDARSEQWKKRLALLATQFSNDTCTVSPVVFSSDLQNIWYKTLVELFDCLGITSLPVPDIRLKQYIDEIVEKRNAVAHGRESPILAAAGRRSPDLEQRYDAVSKTIDYLFDCFEGYLQRRDFVRQDQRAAYP
ncbi:MAE_28990/MAE_18760 family HEPN-like nuclease [Archangium gephyra]|uniref:MAE_28990/MAE_18760 family HEPN-like nuclease n=1 Tax=Archangium gephyra TaxID=48 RepID=UPI0035D4DF9F